MKQLIRMSPGELEQLYAQGVMAPIPAGKIRGQALLNPGTKLAVPTSRGSRLVWQGKIFNPDGQTAVNRFFGVRMIKANVYNAESWRDGRPALILDYSQTSLLYAPYRDEIRQIAPGLFLGLMFDRNTCPAKLKMYFALECMPARLIDTAAPSHSSTSPRAAGRSSPRSGPRYRLRPGRRKVPSARYARPTGRDRARSWGRGSRSRACPRW